MTTKILLGLGLLLIVIQFFRPERNLSGDDAYHISTKYPVPEEVNNLLKVACNDCHSNQTRYPWYANVQPVAWWLDHHVDDGKRHLNFSTFTSRPIAIQNHKFEEIIEMVDQGEMPIKSYLLFGLHGEANLNEAQRQTITDWARVQMDTLKARYPADSLKMPERRRG